MTGTFLSHGVRLEYRTEGEGKPLVFLHGLGGGIGQILSVYQPIDGVKLITLNQQGHGDSGADWDSFGFDRLAEDVIGLLDHLGVESAAFAGISMGAAVCLNTALRFPERVRSLLLIRNAWTDKPMSEAVRQAYGDLAEALRQNAPERFRESEGGKIVAETTPYTKNAFAVPFREEPNLKNWQKFAILPRDTPIPSLEALKAISVPVRVLACKNDFCHPYAYGELLAKSIPGAEFLPIPDKDTDPAEHKRRINRAAAEMMAAL